MPLVGTWIEITERGVCNVQVVVPLVGTWIEILMQMIQPSLQNVVPLVGTWIEIKRQY